MAALLLGGCGLFGGNTDDETIGWSAQRLYGEAKDAMAAKDWPKAVKYLEKLEARYPYGRFAQQAQLEIAYCHWKDDERATVLEAARRVRAQLVAGGVRVKLDERDGVTPGFKFNDWEMRGVPLRIEIGPRDVEKRQVVLARRDTPGKTGKSFVPEDGLTGAVTAMLGELVGANTVSARSSPRLSTRK